jgi:hypothetical protein
VELVEGVACWLGTGVGCVRMITLLLEFQF